MLPSYFDCIFVHLRQKACLRPELSRKSLSSLGLNPARNPPKKPGLTYNSGIVNNISIISRITLTIVNVTSDSMQQMLPIGSKKFAGKLVFKFNFMQTKLQF